MWLYIVRHAFAGQHGDPRYPDDALRPLTPKGRKQFSRLVKKLAARGFTPAVVACSPLVRCRQTAEVICDRVSPSPELFPLEALAPGSRLAALVAWSNKQRAESVAWVGHAPDVDVLAAALLGARDDLLRLGKGAITAIRFDGPIVPGQGQLRWFVSPRVLGR